MADAVGGAGANGAPTSFPAWLSIIAIAWLLRVLQWFPAAHLATRVVAMQCWIDPSVGTVPPVNAIVTQCCGGAIIGNVPHYAFSLFPYNDVRHAGDQIAMEAASQFIALVATPAALVALFATTRHGDDSPGAAAVAAAVFLCFAAIPLLLTILLPGLPYPQAFSLTEGGAPSGVGATCPTGSYAAPTFASFSRAWVALISTSAMLAVIAAALIGLALCFLCAAASTPNGPYSVRHTLTRVTRVGNDIEGYHETDRQVVSDYTTHHDGAAERQEHTEAAGGALYCAAGVVAVAAAMPVLWMLIAPFMSLATAFRLSSGTGGSLGTLVFGVRAAILHDAPDLVAMQAFSVMELLLFFVPIAVLVAPPAVTGAVSDAAVVATVSPYVVATGAN